MLRVLFPFVSEDLVGGSHISALNLITGFDRAQIDPLIVLHKRSDALEGEISKRGLACELLHDVPVLAPRYSRTEGDVSLLRYFVQTLPRSIGYLKQQRIDIVHTNDGRMHATWALPSRLAGCHLVWHHRAAPDAKGVNYLAPLLANRIVSVSEFSRPASPILTIDRKFSVVRSPMLPPKQTPSKRRNHVRLCEELKAPTDALLLGYVGLLNERKRPVHFVEAVAEVIEAGPDRPVHGLIFGCDEVETLRLEDACRTRASELGVSDRIHLMGFRNPIEPEMAGLDILLVSAINEPFGRTLIEAMRLGTPVVATRHGGNIEAIEDGETGFLVDHEDPASFVAPVLSLGSDPDLYDRVSRAAREKTAREFDCEYAAAAITEIYRSILGKQAHP